MDYGIFYMKQHPSEDKKKDTSLAWWPTPLITTFGRQLDLCEFKVSQGHAVCLCLKTKTQNPGKTDAMLIEMMGQGTQQSQVCGVQWQWKRSPFSLKCTVHTSLVQTICPLGCHTCYRFCAFFHPPGQAALLLDLGDSAFHNLPHQGVNYRSRGETEQAITCWVSTTEYQINVFIVQAQQVKIQEYNTK